MMKKNAGFTLVELLVVIGILGLLMVAILPQLGMAQLVTRIRVCTLHLRNLHHAVINIHSMNQEYPKGEGLEFLYNTWRYGLDHNENGRDTMFCPCIHTDVAIEKLARLEPDEIWRSPEEFGSEMTHYAALSMEAKRHISSGTTVLFADDNENGNNHPDGSFNLIYGDGTVRTYSPQYLEEIGVYRNRLAQPQDEEQVLIVGPGSQIRKLRQLKHN